MVIAPSGPTPGIAANWLAGLGLVPRDQLVIHGGQVLVQRRDMRAIRANMLPGGGGDGAVGGQFVSSAASLTVPLAATMPDSAACPVPLCCYASKGGRETVGSPSGRTSGPRTGRIAGPPAPRPSTKRAVCPNLPA
jgi:hypothetical protein